MSAFMNYPCSGFIAGPFAGAHIKIGSEQDEFTRHRGR